MIVNPGGVVNADEAEMKEHIMIKPKLPSSGGAIMISVIYPVQVEYSDYTCVKSYVSV